MALPFLPSLLKLVDALPQVLELVRDLVETVVYVPEAAADRLARQSDLAGGVAPMRYQSGRRGSPDWT